MLGRALGERAARLSALASSALQRSCATSARQLSEDGAVGAGGRQPVGKATLPPSPPPPPELPDSQQAPLPCSGSKGSSSGSTACDRLKYISSWPSRRAWLGGALLSGPAVLQSPVLHPRVVGQHSFASSGGSSGGGDNPLIVGSAEKTEMVRRRGGRRGLLPVRPELAGELAALAAQCGLGSGSLPTLAEKAAALGPTREQGVLQHGQQVVAHLQRLGLAQRQLGALLLACPMLFSWPWEQRAAVLVEQQLMARLGLTAAEAAECFRQESGAANTTSFDATIDRLAALLLAASGSQAAGTAAAGTDTAEQQAGEQLLAQLLRDAPAAIRLLALDAGTLRQPPGHLRQRYGLSFKQLTKAVKHSWRVLALGADDYDAREALLQQELGVDGRQLVGAMLKGAGARAAGGSQETLRQRSRALVAPGAFTKQQLQGRKSLGPLAEMLAVNTAVWQLALAVWRHYGVADPLALALNSLASAARNWLDPTWLAKLLALQDYLQLPAAYAVQRCAAYSTCSSQRLVGRLLLLEQRGPPHVLVADKQQWRREQGLPPGKPASGEPLLISLCDVANLGDPAFCTLTGISPAAYSAFMAAVKGSAAYQRWLAAGLAERARLLRYPEVARLAAECAAALDEGQEGEAEDALRG